MTAIRALPSMPYMTALNSERINYRCLDPIASGFQSQLQNQVRLSRSDALNQPATQKPLISTSPRRADIDSMLAQLLASKKMLLQPTRSVSFSGKSVTADLAECNMTDNACGEPSDVSPMEYVHKPAVGLCNKIHKMHPELRCDPCCYYLVSDFPVTCPQPSVVMMPLSSIYIWIAPEFVRARLPFCRGQPLQIRRLRPLNKTRYRQSGRHQNRERYLKA
ncbi:hypothetical protein F3I27_23560 [Pantoea sp. Bo_2]|uniref:hypothetical protein n=1 Tax=unclassified Pantoea TaxID=2630326 RepID=UPI001232E877|nr:MULTISPECIES: hypothetical protein [unclassified Pantoea]KAA5945719.1 hypothetical protein F3I56_22710 [Pantoea sp. VH_25]KAA5952448.1 hypothetical protein F3I53_23510 [Pantoea sp. VH_16]KAA5957871.1 hypothetical protein F3I55_07170 [Pantoea sp. VH_24]KAA5962865.1 hypothetical protein F3I54_16110 [Pantoea sp. VH_18]KAA5976743.1 hypothetical protein F3I48_22470 [Pantoea sp. M_3]